MHGASTPAAWLERRAPWMRLALAALAGVALTLGHAPVSLPWTVFVAVPLLVVLLATARSARGAFALGWAAGFGYFVSGLHWIGHAFVVDAERFAWALPFAVTLLPAYLALYWGLGAVLARWLAKGRPLAWPFALATCLTLAEIARATLFTGFPWNLLGHVWVDTPAAQAAAWAGPYGMTLLTLLVAGLPVLGWGSGRPWGPVAAAFLGLVLWGTGSTRLEAPAPPPTDTVVRIVQPNAPQHLKWKAGHRERFAERLRRLSGDPQGSAAPPDIVVWPETAATFLPEENREATRQAATSARGATLVTGALSRDYAPEAPGGVEWSNALFALGPEGRILATYHKQHLVPFGEYMPFEETMRSLGLEAVAGMVGAGMRPGTGPRLVDLPGLPAFAPAICYEMIFAHEVIEPGTRPAWILHLTNDAWFGAFAGPQQHLAQARLRAIEQGLPVVRAANTGISAIIDAKGRVLASLALGTHGRLDHALPAALAPTPYARLGDGPALAALALLFGLLGLSRLPRRPRRPPARLGRGRGL